MFSLFKSKEPKITIIDKVWMSKQAKWAACKGMALANPDCLFVAWFEKTFQELIEILGGTENGVLAEQLDASKAAGRMVVFVEHYPLSKKEYRLFEMLPLKEVPVLSSLDEPLFMHFGGERTIELMKKLGVQEHEPIGHSMITSSIKRAQEKLERDVTVERTASSADEWFVLNVSK